MSTLFLFGLLALLIVAAATGPQIVGSIRLGGRSYRKGDEADLSSRLTPELHDSLQGRGLIGGGWSLSAATSGASTPPAAPLAALKPLGMDVVASLIGAGFDSPQKIREAVDDDLDLVPGIGPATIEKIRNLLS